MIGMRNPIKNLIKENKRVFEYASYRGRAPFFNIAKRYLADCENVLDIGSGDGNFEKFMDRDDIFALEGNEDSVTKLKKMNINAVYSKLPQIPFLDIFFDGIHASHVLEHLVPTDFYNTLLEINRVLKPGGILVISGPMLWKDFYSDLSHVKPYNPGIFVEYLCKTSCNTATRMHIGGYIVQDLIYRYHFEELEPIVFESVQFYLFNFLSIGIYKLLNKLGIKRIHKSGYTIVLKKN